jgi:hypothetical protein
MINDCAEDNCLLQAVKAYVQNKACEAVDCILDTGVLDMVREHYGFEV